MNKIKWEILRVEDYVYYDLSGKHVEHSWEIFVMYEGKRYLGDTCSTKKEASYRRKELKEKYSDEYILEKIIAISNKK